MNTKPYNAYWVRSDMRVQDNPALLNASQEGLPMIAFYIYETFDGAFGEIGSASKVWLHHSLLDLKNQLSKLEIPLLIIKAEAIKIWKTLAHKTSLKGVYWNRRYDPNGLRVDTEAKAYLRQEGIGAESFVGNVLFEPHSIQNKQGGPFQVFTPFWKHCTTHNFPTPYSDPKKVPALSSAELTDICSSIEASQEVDSLQLLPSIPWNQSIEKAWDISRKGAIHTLDEFIKNRLANYAIGRDFPDQRSTSSLSPYLRWGQISPREVIANLAEAGSLTDTNFQKFVAEIGWREFAYHLLWHFPETPTKPLKPQYAQFPFAPLNTDWLNAWQKGQTGYPLIDAGMRELWKTGTMHNRVRMVAGSFWVKHLLQPWQNGAEWFWDTLVDADLASNTLGWQWVAGCGADAAPYFRVFNPVTQGLKHDSEGRYTLSYVPELKKLPLQYLHAPWETPPSIARGINLEFGQDYPEPLIKPDEGRKKALDAYEQFQANNRL